MNEIVLTACNESHFPISAMAAFGVLRVLSLKAARSTNEQRNPFDNCAKLSWKQDPRWTAVLHTQFTQAEVLQMLAEAACQADKAPVWNTCPDLRKLTPEAYRKLLDQFENEDLATSLACEWPLAKSGALMITPFFMTSGQQQWCNLVCKAAKISMLSAGSTDGALEEALLGPWRYKHELSALGWDPATERQYALEAQAPTKSNPKSVGAAVWLAAESLALFPCFAVGRNLQIPSFDMTRHRFYWPVWQSPLTYNTLRMILQLPFTKTLQSDDNRTLGIARREMQARGISAVFASRRIAMTAGHGYYTFGPAELVWQS